MKARKIMSVLMAGVLTLSMAACGETGTEPAAPTETEAPTEEAGNTGGEEENKPTPVEQPAYEIDPNASILFGDGSISFLGSDKSMNPSAGDLEMVVGDAGVRVTATDGGKMFVGIQMDELLGDKVSDVARVEFGLETQQGSSFSAKSGKIYTVLGGTPSNVPWSIFTEKGNPKAVGADISGAQAGDYIVLSLEESGAKEGLEGAELYINYITFKDAAGNTLPVDTSVAWKGVEGGPDTSNLYAVAGGVEYEANTSAGGWAQADILTLIEIKYSSGSGNMWIVMPGAAAGWMRVGVGDTDGSGQEYAYLNNSRDTAQITYEQIAAVCGDDTSTWGDRIQAESDADWEVYSVTIGQAAYNYSVANAVDITLPDATSADGWSQIGYIDLSDEALEKLHTPGSVVEIDYSSDDGDIWFGLSGDAWNRIGVGNADGSGTVDAITDGSKCFVTYDMIAEICGDDPEAWDKQFFIESDSHFEVYSAKVGTGVPFIPNNRQVDAGISGTGDGWAQIDYNVTLSDEALEALKAPGSVVNVSYTSETGEAWIVMTSGDNGWVRVGVGDYDGSGSSYAACNGSYCQVTHDQIAEAYGEDPDTWGNQIVIEASSAFEVFGVTIGQGPVAE